MARWQPGAHDRLCAAALDLFAEQGYEQTTTAGIAERAGLTERTFFRYFDDKREVLFSGQDDFVRGFLDAVAAAPADASPMQVVAAALDASAVFFNDRLQHSRRRDAIIGSHRGLRERELLKMAALSRAIADGLVARGTAEPTATLAAETCVTVFRVAFERWLAGSGPAERRMLDVQREVLAELTRLTGPGDQRQPPAAAT